MKLGKGTNSLALSPLYAFQEKAALIPDVINLGIGESDFPTPAYIRRAAQAALDKERIGYTPATGMKVLRAAIARQLGVQPLNIAVSNGAKTILETVFRVLLLGEKDAAVLIPEPYYSPTRFATELNGGRAIIVPTEEKKGFIPTINQLKSAVRKSRNIRALVINYPNNPTGAIITRSQFQEILAFTRKQKDMWLISDEAYLSLVYKKGGCASGMNFWNTDKDRLIVVRSFSKDYAMTGWRLGYAVGPEHLIKAMSIIFSNAHGNACTISQYGALAAIQNSNSDHAKWINTFRANRDMIVKTMKGLGLRFSAPPGAFYAFIDFGKFIKKNESAVELADRILTQCKVLVTPGSSFGADFGDYLRICYARHPDTIKDALGRLTNFFQTVNKNKD